MKQWNPLLLVGIALVLLAGGLVLAFVASTGNSTALRAFARLRPGMTRQEVEKAVGMAPGDYRRRYFATTSPSAPAMTPDNSSDYPQGEPGQLTEECWQWDDYWLFVDYNERD